MSIIYTIFAFIVALGILIVVHEFGHYWVAKTLGVKVLRFSIGFGRPLWRKNIGVDRTELVIAALPLGGYVKMLDENEATVAESEKHRAFNRQSIVKRTAIVVAGPLFNFLFAIIAYWLLFIGGINDIKPVVGGVAEGSIAQQAGFQRGDELLKIDSKTVVGWSQHRLYLFQKLIDKEGVNIMVRDAQGNLHARPMDFSGVMVKDVDASFLEREIGLYRYSPPALPVAGKIYPGAAQDAGLRRGDHFVRINGNQVESWEQLVDFVRTHPGVPIKFSVKRDDQIVDFTITPKAVNEDEKLVGKIGVAPQVAPFPDSYRVKVRYNPIEALWRGIDKTWSMSALTLKVLYKMLKFEVSAKNISGPITIAQYAGETAKIGINQFLLFLAVVSISLGVLNLLPIPILDGGHLLYYLIEAIKGSPVSEKFMLWGQQVGIVILVGLMILAFYNDFTRLLY